MERVGDHVRRGQGDRHRRREPHLRPGAPVGIPASGHPGSLGLADRHPAGARQRRRRAAPRGGCGPRAAPQEPCPGHRRRGILHRHMASRDPVHDILPGHRVIITRRDRRRSRRRRPRRPAHPQHPRTSAALQARPESPPEIPARHRDEGNHHRETAGHRVRPRVLISTAAARTRQEGGSAPPAGAADRGTARHPRRGRGQKPCPHPGTPSRKRTQGQTRNTKLEKLPNATNT